MIVYISIGNSDDKLSQREWANFLGSAWQLINTEKGAHVHGEWHSSPTSAYQNACWCVELSDGVTVGRLRAGLRHLAREYRQDSIAWAVASTEFLPPIWPVRSAEVEHVEAASPLNDRETP